MKRVLIFALLTAIALPCNSFAMGSMQPLSIVKKAALSIKNTAQWLSNPVWYVPDNCVKDHKVGSVLLGMMAFGTGCGYLLGTLAAYQEWPTTGAQGTPFEQRGFTKCARILLKAGTLIGITGVTTGLFGILIPIKPESQRFKTT